MCIKDGLYTKEKVRVLGKGGTVGVDTQKFSFRKKTIYNKEIRDQYNISPDSTVLGFVGRIQRDKGINELLTAFKNLLSSNNQAILMLVGAVDYANPVDDELMKWAENEKNVVFTGQVGDVYKYMSCFDVLVHPTYREGFGMVLQEAAALKIPIITTRIMGPREFITDQYNGELVEAKNSEQLEVAIGKLLKDSVLRAEYAERIYEYTLKYFERSIMVDRIIQDRERIISEKIR
jgi:glycosyltransferase involved in cell wall biosynthesis